MISAETLRQTVCSDVSHEIHSLTKEQELKQIQELEVLIAQLAAVVAEAKRDGLFQSIWKIINR